MEKLVRDLIPQIIKDSGRKPDFREAISDDEFKKFLKLKVLEEAKELLSSDKDTELEEIADIQEVIYTLLGLLGHKCWDLDEAVKTKLQERGGFRKRYILNM